MHIKLLFVWTLLSHQKFFIDPNIIAFDLIMISGETIKSHHYYVKIQNFKIGKF